VKHRWQPPGRGLGTTLVAPRPARATRATRSAASWTPPARSSPPVSASRQDQPTRLPTHPSSATLACPPTPPSPGGADASSASNSPDQGRECGCGNALIFWLLNASPGRAAWPGWTSTGAAQRAVRDSGPGGLRVVLGGGGALGLGAPCDRTFVTARAANVPQCGFSSQTAGGSRYRCGEALHARHLAILPRPWLHDTSNTRTEGRPR
jgi:hypothetical protein